MGEFGTLCPPICSLTDSIGYVIPSFPTKKCFLWAPATWGHGRRQKPCPTISKCHAAIGEEANRFFADGIMAFRARAKQGALFSRALLAGTRSAQAALTEEQWISRCCTVQGLSLCPVASCRIDPPLREKPPVVVALRDIIQGCYPQHARRRRQILSQDEEKPKRHATWALSQQLEQMFRGKTAFNLEAVKGHVDRGPDVTAKSLTYAQVSLMLVLLKSKHLPEKTVRQAVNLLRVTGTALRSTRKSSSSSDGGLVSDSQGEWYAVSQMGGAA